MDEEDYATTSVMVARIVTNLQCDKYPNYLETRAPCRNVQATDPLLSEFGYPTPFQNLFAYAKKKNAAIQAKDKKECKSAAEILYLVLATETAHYTDLESALRFFKETSAGMVKAFLCLRVLNKIPEAQPYVQQVATTMRAFLVSLT